MTCMVDCVINKHSEQCIDCISKDVEHELPSVELAEAEPVVEADPEPKSCHGSDYLKCAFVIAGCASSCSNSQVRTSVK